MVGLVVLVSGCGSAASGFEEARVREYTSFDEVASYSTDLVIGHVVDDAKIVSASSDTGLPSASGMDAASTLVTMKVVEVLGGRSFAPGQDVVIRQLGTEADLAGGGDHDSILHGDETYFAYLEPFYFEPGTSTGQFVMVGDVAGVYSAVSRNATLTAGKTGLPSSVTRQALERTVVGLGSRATPLGLPRHSATP